MRYLGYSKHGPSLSGMVHRRRDLTRSSGPYLAGRPSGILAALRSTTCNTTRKQSNGRFYSVSSRMDFEFVDALPG
jgi:hypothetical protein